MREKKKKSKVNDGIFYHCGVINTRLSFFTISLLNYVTFKHTINDKIKNKLSRNANTLFIHINFFSKNKSPQQRNYRATCGCGASGGLDPLVRDFLKLLLIFNYYYKCNY